MGLFLPLNGWAGSKDGNCGIAQSVERQAIERLRLPKR